MIPFDIVAYAYTLLWDNLSQNSCIYEHAWNFNVRPLTRPYREFRKIKIKIPSQQ